MTTVGKPTIHMVWKVPAEKESDMDAFWREHEAWMRSSHTAGPAGDDSTGPRLMEFYIAKGKELKNPMAPDEGETGMLAAIAQVGGADF